MALADDILDKIGEHITSKVIDRLPKSSGKLIESVSHKVSTALGSITVEGEMLFYWTNIEGGRKKGAKGIPIKALADFIINKGITRDFKEAKPIAFAMQKKIKRDGIKPKPFLDSALQASIPVIEDLVGRYVDIELKQIINHFQ
tara:strand:+ start:4796 stop:5227 length:432 start_codon:yes stop_codon:yes gene_type:complete